MVLTSSFGLLLSSFVILLLLITFPLLLFQRSFSRTCLLILDLLSKHRIILKTSSLLVAHAVSYVPSLPDHTPLLPPVLTSSF